MNILSDVNVNFDPIMQLVGEISSIVGQFLIWIAWMVLFIMWIVDTIGLIAAKRDENDSKVAELKKALIWKWSVTGGLTLLGTLLSTFAAVFGWNDISFG